MLEAGILTRVVGVAQVCGEMAEWLKALAC